MARALLLSETVKHFLLALCKTIGLLALTGASGLTMIAVVFALMSASGVCIDALDCNSREDVARDQLAQLRTAVRDFQNVCGRFPSPEEGLF